ncbi:hemerythrin-like metal-binding protein [hydrothermal vent metagenome]|uniref:Hemerythrin-like metal-binding protein n=1 Tax=hydrothermal vent metagenome TaxID=652676 RepID=A0A1W1BC25_9ZZZZ
MIAQEQLPMVAMPSMNDTHLEDIILINQLSAAAQSRNIPATKIFLEELIEHSISHFSGEEAMMKEYNFPPYAIHKAEHDRVLKELNNVTRIFSEGEGDFSLVTSYVDGSLIPWLLNHIETLDTVSAMFIVNATKS